MEEQQLSWQSWSLLPSPPSSHYIWQALRPTPERHAQRQTLFPTFVPSQRHDGDLPGLLHSNSLSPRVSFFITSPSTLLLPVAMQFPPQINSHQTSFQWLHIQASRGLRVEQEEKKHTLLPNHILSTPFILELGCSIYTYCLKISRNTKINILVYQCSALLKSFPNVSKATRWKVFGFLSHKP